MMKILSLIILLVSFQLVGAQEKVVKNIDTIYSFKELDVKPEFPGGINEFYIFIGRNYKTPLNKGLNGTVFTSFIIEKDGEVTDIKVSKDIGYGSGEEAIRVLKLCQKWKPGEKNGQKVRCLFGLPILIESSIDNPTPKKSKFEKKAEFIGGMNRLYEFIGENYKVPIVAGLAGKIYVTFGIEIDGSLVDIRVLRDLGYGTGKEAIRVLKMCPKWNPAEQDGKAVKSTFSLPINIQTR